MFSGLNKADYEPISTEKPARIHSPDPFLRAGNPPRFCQILIPQKIVLAKPSPHFAPPHCPNTWRAEHQRKISFPFSRKISPPPNQESKEHFSLVLPSEARQWRNDSFHIGILLEKGSDFVQETQSIRK